MNEAPAVLIIDDDSRNIFALAAVLRAKGFTVSSATSAAEGFSLLQRDQGIKLVLLDMMMPGMDGYEALAQLRGDAALRHLSVIAVTAQAMTGDREKCLEAGADAYVSKPVDIDLLLHLIAQLQQQAP